MSDLPHEERRPIAHSAKKDEQAGGVTRRTVLAGAAAATAAAKVATNIIRRNGDNATLRLDRRFSTIDRHNWPL
jgi:hypothetical protein